LQTPIVQERYLHRRIDGQKTAKKTLNSIAHLLSIVGRANGNDILPEGLTRNIGDDRHSAIGRECCASGQRKRRKQRG
jgi:hypothetical protein